MKAKEKAIIHLITIWRKPTFGYDTTFSTIKLPAQQPLRSGEAYEIMVKTDCVLRFKLTMTSDRVVGDTGIVKYIIAPPNYEQIVLLNEGS